MSSLELNPDEYPWKIEAQVVGYGKLDPKEHMVFDHENARGVDYSGRILKQFGAVGCRFEHCRFDKMRIGDFSYGAGRETSQYIECTFDRLRFGHGGGLARFVRCSFKDVDIRGWCSYKTEFIDCVFTGRLRTSIFYGTVPEEDRPWVGREKNEFQGNDFSGAELIDVAFRTGIDLERQRLPSGPDYLYIPDAPAAIERAKRGLADWMPGTELQREALILVEVYGDTVENGQNQLIIHIPDYLKGPAKTPRESVDKVVELFSRPS